MCETYQHQTTFSADGENMLKGVGIDIESIHRIDRLLRRYELASLRMVFTAGELQRGYDASLSTFSTHHLTLCFAAKEAMGKALGTGLATIAWHEVEADPMGEQLTLTLHGKAFKRAMDLAVSCWQAWWFGWHDHRMVVVLLR
jgi:holo-[acyl-carrier protein] synthase